jgi:hypothetical protein
MMISWVMRARRSRLLGERLAKRRTWSGSSDAACSACLGEEADRSIGVLSSWLMLATKSRHSIEPVRLGAVLREQPRMYRAPSRATRTKRCRCSRRQRAASELELLGDRLIP